MGMKFSEKIQILLPLAQTLCRMEKSEEKAEYLKGFSPVQKYLSANIFAQEILDHFEPHCQVSLLSLIALGEGDVLFCKFTFSEEEIGALHDLAERLVHVEKFYHAIGGIIGYYLAFIRLLADTGKHSHEGVGYENPETFDLSVKSALVKDATLIGLEHLNRVAAIFPVGGAGDRLDLHDEESGQPLPAAKLKFCGSSLLQQMISDIQALEYLYYKLFARQVMVPIALMTSFEKDNHNFIREICAASKWFYRDPESIFTVVQPLVPVITEEGRFAFSSPHELNWKPGGHGVIWKLAIDEGVVDHLLHKGIDKAFLRQVNNPLAGLDNNILGLIGRGFEEDMDFGVIACERPVNTQEGMIVLKKVEGKYCLTNIEYTEFVKEGLEDKPKEEGEPYSIYPANTNILFADFKAVKNAIEKDPFPGLMINLKAKFTSMDESGVVRQVKGGRLETLMQNISDKMVYSLKGSMRSFAVYNPRQKVISSTKRTYEAGKYEIDTPENAFYDLLVNHRDLLSNHCRFHMPAMPSFEEYLEKGPSFVLKYHPSLGPLYEIIAQKLSAGVLGYGSHLELLIAELDIDNLYLDGSLQIASDFPMGRPDDQNHMIYSEKGPKCEMINCTVVNKGIDRKKVSKWWKNRYSFEETCRLAIHGNGEFFAEDVAFHGPLCIEVPDGQRVTASMDNGKVVFDRRVIKDPAWYWIYSIDDENNIVLTKKEYALQKGLSR